MLREEPYVSNLVGFVVDEAHCVKKWGESFRNEFSRLGEVRSILPRNVHVMALTATASSTLHHSITWTLGMQNTALIEVSPDKKYALLQLRNPSPLSFVILLDKKYALLQLRNPSPLSFVILLDKSCKWGV
jgi:superfamily II DNA helicase RecQ